MIRPPENIHPAVAKILRDLKLNPYSRLGAKRRKKLALALTEVIREIEIDRDLLEKSLKLAVDEMDTHYMHLAQSANITSLGEMAANVAHEINNPLHILLSLVEFAQLQLKNGGDKAVIDAKLTTMQSHIQRIAKIVKGLKNLGRESSQDDFSPTSVRDCVSDCLSVLQMSIQEKDVELKVPDQWPDLQFDSRGSQVSQVLINLLGNACDAVEHLPPPKWVELKLESTDDWLSFYVFDSGPGVPLELEDKIMKAFFTTKPKGKGTGLGLSISMQIARDHGGYLKLRRDLTNSCFEFKIKRNLTAVQQRKVA